MDITSPPLEPTQTVGTGFQPVHSGKWETCPHTGVPTRRLGTRWLGPLLPVGFLLLFCAFLFFFGLADRDLHSSHEARAAQNAQIILSEGTWGLPRLFDRHLELQKPPLYYWLVALLGRLLGGQVDGWAVRLPAALSALGCVVFLYFLGKKCGRPVAGFLAALILATSLHFTWLARIGRIDMPLTLAVAVAVGSFYLGMCRRLEPSSRRAWPWFALGYVGVALGLLLKGPIALVLAGVVAGAVALQENRLAPSRPSLRVLGCASMAWGLPLVALIAAPWFVWANLQTNNKIWEVFFCYHNLERGLGSEVLASHPFWFYLPRVALDLLPWSLALPAALWFFLGRIRWAGDCEARLGAVWFLAVFLLLSCMSFKRADYLLPAYPGFALFLGCVGERFWLRARERSDTTMSLAGPGKPALLGPILAGLMLACSAAGWGVYNLWIVPRQEQGWPYQRLARDIRARTDKPVIFFRAESHVLAFHVGRPLDTILEWENLDIWASQPFPVYFVMPADCARDWPQHLAKGRLEEVCRITDQSWGQHKRFLVVMRSCPALP